nr:hypothetical protein Iba_chr02dCG7770 [Ipomoea batatas]
MEIKSYMDVVYDNVQRIHVEDEDAMALKACIILMEMDKADPSGGCLGPDTKLGCQLRANQERAVWIKRRLGIYVLKFATGLRNFEGDILELDAKYG